MLTTILVRLGTHNIPAILISLATPKGQLPPAKPPLFLRHPGFLPGAPTLPLSLFWGLNSSNSAWVVAVTRTVSECKLEGVPLF